jgi:hypothetical protein
VRLCLKNKQVKYGKSWFTWIVLEEIISDSIKDNILLSILIIYQDNLVLSFFVPPEYVEKACSGQFHISTYCWSSHPGWIVSCISGNRFVALDCEADSRRGSFQNFLKMIFDLDTSINPRSHLPMSLECWQWQKQKSRKTLRLELCSVFIKDTDGSAITEEMSYKAGV